MCGICNVVNRIRRSICGCGYNNRSGRNSYYNYNGCDRCSNSYQDYDSRRREPRMNVTCANQSDCCFEPCCDNDCRCQRNSSNHCGCND